MINTLTIICVTLRIVFECMSEENQRWDVLKQRVSALMFEPMQKLRKGRKTEKVGISSGADCLSYSLILSLIIQLYTSSRNRKELSHSYNASNASTHPHHSYQNYEDIRRWKRRRYWTRMAQKSLLSKSITKSDTEMIERKDKPSDAITREQLYSSLSNISTHRWIRLQMHYNITKVLDIDVKESLFIAFG